MPQVFGAEDLDLIKESSLWVEAISKSDIEKLTHPAVAAEARARGLVPLRMGLDPIWHHPDVGKIHSLAPAHTGDVQRRIKNDIADLRRNYPTAEETSRASRSPEEVAADSAAAAAQTRSKKQQAVDAAKRRKEQEAAIAFRRDHSPFRNMGEVQQAFDAKDARVSGPGETVDQFAERLRSSPIADRQKIHMKVFPERYRSRPER